MTDAIISIKPRHVENILSGAKTIELRTRNMNLPLGSTLWVYTTLPVGKIEFSVDIDFIELMSPKKTWEQYSTELCITRKEFDKYTVGRDSVSAIGLMNIRQLKRGICLETMRKYEKNFQPPQFFSKLYPERALYSAFYSY